MSGRRVLEDRLASASSMILFSVSDSNIDSQIASAATPAAPGTLLMANLPHGVATDGRRSWRDDRL
jgi:hypothetical protein